MYFPLAAYQRNYDGVLTAPKGDTASFPGSPTNGDGAAVQSAQGVYAPPQYAAGAAQGASHDAMGGGAINWNAAAAGSAQDVNRQAPGGGPTGMSVTSVSGPNQASRLLPPPAGVSFPQPQSYVGGQLENYMANFEHGDSQRQTEELSVLPPPPVPGPPSEEYKGGDLHMYSSMFEHGDHARETEERGEPPYRPYFGSAPSTGVVGPVAVAAVPVAPAGLPIFYPPGPIGLDPRTYYLFITGQLPPGTFSHASATHEAGGSHYGEAHYERFGPQPRLTETQEVSSDMGMQQSGGGRKGY